MHPGVLTKGQPIPRDAQIPQGQRWRGKALDRGKQNAGKKQRQKKHGGGSREKNKEATEIWKAPNKMP